MNIRIIEATLDGSWTAYHLRAVPAEINVPRGFASFRLLPDDDGPFAPLPGDLDLDLTTITVRYDRPRDAVLNQAVCEGLADCGFVLRDGVEHFAGPPSCLLTFCRQPGLIKVVTGETIDLSPAATSDGPEENRDG